MFLMKRKRKFTTDTECLLPEQSLERFPGLAPLTVKPDVRFPRILQHCCQSENIHWLVRVSNYQSAEPEWN